MIEVFLFSLLGIFIGLIAGLLPGIHPNQVYVLLIASLPLLSGLSTQSLIALILSTAISNVIFNYIPSIFFSIPDPGTVINVLPGHRMVLEGKGLNALFISIVSAVVALLVGILLLPILLFAIPIIHQALNSYLHFLLSGLAMWMVLLESGYKKKLLALVLFLLSGLWGILTLNSGLISSDLVLFPALTGMFGIAGLLMSVKEVKKLPEQEVEGKMEMGGLWKILLSGLVAGLLIGILPGAGESQAGVLVSQLTNLSQKEFLGSLAAINSSNLLFSIVSLYSLGRIRSGVADAISEVVPSFGVDWLLFTAGVLIFSGCLSGLIAWFMGKRMLKTLEKLDYALISKVILAFTTVMVFLTTGLVGLFVMVISTCLGLLPLLWGVKRTSNMGYLMLPTIVYFAGLVHVINIFLF